MWNQHYGNSSPHRSPPGTVFGEGTVEELPGQDCESWVRGQGSEVRTCEFGQEGWKKSWAYPPPTVNFQGHEEENQGLEGNWPP